LTSNSKIQKFKSIKKKRGRKSELNQIQHKTKTKNQDTQTKIKKSKNQKN